jgi:hypothetical protein
MDDEQIVKINKDAINVKTLRDEIAIFALQGLNASLVNNEEWPCDIRILKMAENAYKQADAMMKEKNKNG